MLHPKVLTHKQITYGGGYHSGQGLRVLQIVIRTPGISVRLAYLASNAEADMLARLCAACVWHSGSCTL